MVMKFEQKVTGEKYYFAMEILFPRSGASKADFSSHANFR